MAKRKASGRASANKARRRATTKARQRSTARPKASRRAKSARKAARPPSRRAQTPARPTAKKAKKAPRPARAAKKRTTSRPVTRRPPNLDRERRTITDEPIPSPPSSLNMDRSASAARSGRHELMEKVRNHTSTGPAMTAGDLDADWESAESIGDEAPGGDNPTPDQDVVDEIGRALGVEYDDDEELRGGDEIVERDRNRWELDPASSDDFDDRED